MHTMIDPERRTARAPVPHLVLIPLMAQGHMIPLVDIGRLLAARGVVITIVTTPLNSLRFKATTDSAVDTGLSIHVAEIPFPCREVGLPDGCENLDTIPSKDLIMNFFNAIAMLRSPVEEHLKSLHPPPTCIISDMGLPWTSKVAEKLRIPRIIFNGTCCFSMVCSTNVRLHKAYEGVESDFEPFVVPGLPHRIEVTKSQLPANFAPKTAASLVDEIREAEAASLGVVLNSFTDLEPEYIDMYQKTTGKKVWAVGPVFGNLAASVKKGRGNRSSIDEDKCVSWLDSMRPKSVIYVSFGTLTQQITSQLIEIGLGLEASKRPFIWVVRAASPEVETWLSMEKFEERNKDTCLLIRGWAPQALILSHPAIGGFLTHCGWNSCIEGVTAGVPMITWPLFAEQFLNERLLVDVLDIGVSMGVKVPTKWREEAASGILIKREEVRRAVERLTEEGRDGEERRRRAGELGNMAKKAVEEEGSSYVNITLLIQDIIQYSTA